MKKLYLSAFLLFAVYSNAQIINFPDPAFKTKLLSGSASVAIIDQNGDGEIDQAEAAVPDYWLNIDNAGISDLTGIEYFYNVTMINCRNNLLTSIDVSNLPNLRELSVDYNHLTALDVSANTQLTDLFADHNQLTSLSMPISVHYINVSYNLLTTLDLSGYHFGSQSFFNDNLLTSVTTQNMTCNGVMALQNNQLTDFTWHNNSALTLLQLDGNPLTSLNLSGGFAGIDLGQVQMESIDLSAADFSSCSVSSPTLRYLNIKNGFDTNMSINLTTPNLEYICANDSKVAELQQQIVSWGIPDCVINSYCNFNPGGEFYTIEGNVRYDLDNNGCNADDVDFPFLRFNISEGTSTGSIIPDNSGHYAVPVQAATHTVTPVLENPAYFNVSPSTISVSFPTDASPNINDFCITPNGPHTDIEIAIVPQGGARPGFDSQYKLVYKNKGTATANGTINVTYGNNVSFSSAVPAIASQSTQVLNWTFSGLQPFEQRELGLTMHVNSPLETPEVNAGDILHYFVSSNTDITDGTPDDNYAFLNQPVVNSLDPNDKTCLEGNAIEPEMVGKYVHYQIRFENTGTANAQNIVVKDVIDTDKFDINSLIPMDASHDFYTRVNDNKVEFIFENIQLPFDDTSNDGYVMFKIKTKPTLSIGDSFSNSASIYFDYNHPIVTDPAVTTVQLLGTKDFEFAQEFALYPNPANDVLNIQSKGKMQIHSIDVYNTLGQLVLAVTHAENVSKMDVSNLRIGNYFLKVKTDKGISNTRFVKN